MKISNRGYDILKLLNPYKLQYWTIIAWREISAVKILKWPPIILMSVEIFLKFRIL